MNIDWNALRLGWEILTTLSSVVALAWVGLLARQKTARKDFDAAAASLRERMHLLELAVAKVPSDNQMDDIHRRIGGISRGLEKLTGEFEGSMRFLREQVSQMNNHLMNR